MSVALKKWGNGHGVHISQAIIDQMQWSENEKLDLKPTSEGLLLIKQTPCKSIKEKYEEFYGKPYDEIDFSDAPDISEIDWGDPVGKEIW